MDYLDNELEAAEEIIDERTTKRYLLGVYI